jgi:hypothetical protein
VPFGLVGLLIWRWRRTHKDAARARPPFRGALYPLHGVTRAAQPLPEGQRARELPAELQDETPAEFHLHFPVSRPRTWPLSSATRTSREAVMGNDRANGKGRVKTGRVRVSA